MQSSGFYSEPKLAAFEPVLGNEYIPSVDKAISEMMSVQHAYPLTKARAIDFIFDFLTQLINERTSQPAKTKAGKVTRFVWKVLNAFGLLGKAKQEVLKKV